MPLEETPRQWSSLLLRLCGDLELIGDGRVRLALPRKALALLAYLVLEPGAHSRHQLSALLWPEADEAKAAMSLRQALTKLREVVGDWLVADRMTAQWRGANDPAFSCDVTRFAKMNDSEEQSASIVNVGELLSAHGVTDAPAFAQWADLTRAQYVKRATNALRDAALAAIAKRDWASAGALAQRWTRLDPHSEMAVSMAMEAAYMRRDIESGRAHFHAYKQRLLADDDEPSANLRAQVQRLESLGPMLTPARGVRAVVASGAAAPQAPLSALGTRMELSSALYERDAQWQVIAKAFDDTSRDGTARVLAIHGANGTGRSRLLRDVTAWMASREATVLSASLSESGKALPYVAIGALINSGVDAPGLGGVDGSYLQTLMQLVPELASRFPGVARMSTSTAPAGWTLLDAWLHVIQALAEEEPLVIAIDDAIWCDAESIGVLHATMERLHHVSIVWLLSLPTSDDAELTSSAASQLLAGATPVHIDSLSVDSVASVLGDLSNTRAGWGPMANHLHRISHGVAAVLFAALERARPVDDDWLSVRAQLADAGTAWIPPLPERVIRRLESLTEMEREVLLTLSLMLEDDHPVSAGQWAAVPPLSPRSLSSLLGISRLRAARIGESLVEYHLAVEVDDGYRCASPMLVQHLLTHGGKVRRNELRRALQHRETVSVTDSFRVEALE